MTGRSDIADKSTPVSFPRWGEVLKSEYSDPEAIRKLEQDVFAYLKFLKAAHFRASVESTLDYLHEPERTERHEFHPGFPAVVLQKRRASVLLAHAAANDQDGACGGHWEPVEQT